MEKSFSLTAATVRPRRLPRHAELNGRVFISPYNDGQVIAGQGTIALEIVEQLSEQYHVDQMKIAAWIFPTGGGGLISGCGAALAASGGSPHLIGVQPEASAFTYSLIRRGTQDGVTDGATLADGLSGPMDEASITIPMMRALVQDILTVDEAALGRAIAHSWWAYGERIEGSSAVALAAALDQAADRRPAVVVLTGGNIQAETFRDLILEYPRGAQV